jgi:hypothetical protein
MRVAPKVWTHHHTQRLFHLSMLAGWSFIIVILVVGLLVTRTQINASGASQDVGVGVTIASISPGPTVIDTTPGSVITPPARPELADNFQPQPDVISKDNQPALEIIPAADLLVNNGGGHAPIFSTQFPVFKGKSNLKNSVVFLEVHSTVIIHGTTFTDDNGNWEWNSPEPVSPGNHTLWVTIQDPNNSAFTVSGKLGFSVALAPNTAVKTSVPAQSLPTTVVGNLFDVLVRIPSQFRTVQPGDDLIASIQLINFGSAGKPVDVEVQYIIQDDSGNVVMQSSETVAVATKLSLLKSFRISPQIKQGSYQLLVRVPSQNIIATASDKFEVKGSPEIALGQSAKIDYTVLFQALGLLLFFFLFVAYFEYNKVSMMSRFIKQVSEADLKSES